MREASPEAFATIDALFGGVGPAEEEVTPYGDPLPLVDQTKYAQIKPILTRMLQDADANGTGLQGFLETLMRRYGEPILPYLMQFHQELQRPPAPSASQYDKEPDLAGNVDTHPELSALDEMFAASRRYRSSDEYMAMLRVISQFPQYAPFNCMLLHTQNPGVSYVATAGTWKRKFNRHPRFEARPLVILAPMSPVLFVYDLKDTEGDPVPEALLRPYRTQGKLPQSVWDLTLRHCQAHGITVRETLLRHQHAGSAMRLHASLRRQYHALTLAPTSQYLVLLNKEYSPEDKYSSLAHELAHIFCGHVGIDENAWWENRVSVSGNKREIEAESVAYLVCQRRSLLANSDKYLADYRTDTVKEMPFFSVNAVLTATGYIEDMGRQGFKKRQSRYKPSQEQESVRHP